VPNVTVYDYNAGNGKSHITSPRSNANSDEVHGPIVGMHMIGALWGTAIGEAQRRESRACSRDSADLQPYRARHRIQAKKQNPPKSE
jgi:hypothetical protein